MVLVSTTGRKAALGVGASYTLVLGVRDVKLNMDWETEKLMHLQDTAKTTIQLLKNWSITGNLTEDFADAGQDIIRAAYNTPQNMEVRYYPNYTDAPSVYYTCAYSVVSKYESGADPTKSETAAFTIDSSGTALTPPS